MTFDEALQLASAGDSRNVDKVASAPSHAHASPFLSCPFSLSNLRALSRSRRGLRHSSRCTGGR